MKLRNLLIGIGVGFSVGYVLRNQVEYVAKLSPERALKIAKAKLEESAPIVGSWIYVKEEHVEKNGLLYYVYRGGVSRNLDGETKQYEFLVDIDTGAVIHVEELNS